MTKKMNFHYQVKISGKRSTKKYRYSHLLSHTVQQSFNDKNEIKGTIISFVFLLLLFLAS